MRRDRFRTIGRIAGRFWSGIGPSRALWALTLVTTLGLCLVAWLALSALRDESWGRAEASAQNILRLIEQDVARNIELFDLSLAAVIDGINLPGFAALGPDMRHAVLFDRSATAKYLGAILVLDADGNVRQDSRAPVPRVANFAERDYFRHHRETVDPNLYISMPYVSTTSGQLVIGLSRRMVGPDGGFAGVIVGTMQLSYFSDLFAPLDVGPNGSISLTRRDGTLLARRPGASHLIGHDVATGEPFRRFGLGGRGWATAESSIDGVRRHYGYGQVADLPLVVSVALSVDDILAEWWRKAIMIAAVVFGLCALAALLNALLLRELRRRTDIETHLQHANARFARLAVTDPLTGLGNRRRFDEDLAAAWLEAQKGGTSLALVTVDADHFKAYNDLYGHAGGDDVLRRLAAQLRTVAMKEPFEPCRVGGEEFCLLLPGRGEADAFAIAEALRTAVEEQALPHAGSPRGAVSISLGVAAVVPTPSSVTGMLVEAADAALYRAKAGGRNRTATLSPSALLEALVPIGAPARRRAAQPSA